MRSFARATLAGVLACGGRLPVPPYVTPPEAALAPVPYPPPPARVEFIPSRPSKESFWVDGEWAWRGRRWSWRPGRWIVPPKGARFSPWALVRGEDGTLYFASGAWRDAKGGALPEPAPLAVAKPTTGAVVNPEGEREVTGNTLRGGAGGAPTASLPARVPAQVSDAGAPRGGGSARQERAP